MMTVSRHSRKQMKKTSGEWVGGRGFGWELEEVGTYLGRRRLAPLLLDGFLISRWAYSGIWRWEKIQQNMRMSR